jgi:hypothetical protein
MNPLITQAMRLCNAHQRQQFLAFLIQQREDQAMFGPDAVIADRIAPWPCDAVPGIVAAWSGPFCVQAFLPEPRPIPCDPFFQHAESLTVDSRLWFGPLNANHRAMWRDWQWAAGLPMDAPDTMPAGACEGFDYGEYEGYGARQMTTNRE